jgi:ArsR family transcriptional regulator
MDRLLQAMRALAEPTRLRIVHLCAHSELTVSDLVHLLGQSQPRLSRHLKLLVEAGVLERHQEGAWARYRLADGPHGPGEPAAYVHAALDLIPSEDPALARDLDRLESLREKRDREAAAYFARNAAQWDRIRALHVDEAALEARIEAITADWPLGRVLDVGTGTGKLLELIAPRAEAAVGIDRSPDMLRLARAAIERDGLGHCQVRQADMAQLPYPDAAFDTAIFHMVLHYAADPDAALREAARALRPGGRVLIVDFAAHTLAELRAEHAHRWPGFSDARMRGWLEAAGFTEIALERLEGGALTVCVWTACRNPDRRREAAA